MNEHHPQHQPEHVEHEQPPQLQPRIWIGSLADYNAGRLHGDWVDAAVDERDLRAAAQAILASSHEPGAEEIAIFDHDDFGTYRVQEYEPLERVAALARGIRERGEAYAAWAELVRHDAPERLDDFEDHYLGHYDSVTDWADEILHDGVLSEDLDRVVPESLRSYVRIDAEAFARDAELGGDIQVEHDPAGGVWLFHTH